MNKTLIVISTNRGLYPKTLDSVRALRNLGARLVQQEGASDVTLARNHALSMAMVALDSKEGAGIDTILMVDDDMVFTVDDAQRVVDRTRATRAPASATYIQEGGALAGGLMPAQCATRRGGGMLQMRPGSWQVGLGFMAFPAATLVDLAIESDRFTLKGDALWEFTRSGAIDDTFVSEDFCLCRRLGGVELLPIEVGHLKMTPIYPHENMLKKVAELGAEWVP